MSESTLNYVEENGEEIQDSGFPVVDVGQPPKTDKAPAVGMSLNMSGKVGDRYVKAEVHIHIGENVDLEDIDLTQLDDKIDWMFAYLSEAIFLKFTELSARGGNLGN